MFNNELMLFPEELGNMAEQALKAKPFIVALGENGYKDGNIKYKEKRGIRFYVAGAIDIGDDGHKCTAYACDFTDELFNQAVRNTMEMARIGDMLDAVNNTMHPIAKWEPCGDPMLVLTKKDRFHGAGILMCDELLRKIYDKIGTFYIIPSSIHEVMIVPGEYNNEQTDMLKEIINDVNREGAVAESEILGWKPFFFDGSNW